MKNTILLLSVIIVSLRSYAQPTDPGDETKKEKPTGHAAAYFILSAGINNNPGLFGLGVEASIAKQASLAAGLGIGFWGNKFYLCGKYYLRPDMIGWAFGPGITYSSGFRRLYVNLETNRSSSEVVIMHADPQTNLFVAAYRSWRLGNKYNRIHIEFGWSFRLAAPSYYQVAGNTITPNSDKVIKTIAPGGPIAAMAVSFGGRKK